MQIESTLTMCSSLDFILQSLHVIHQSDAHAASQSKQPSDGQFPNFSDRKYIQTQKGVIV